MFDIGWSEMTVVVVIALLVIGPKQLPGALKTVTKFTRQARRYAQDFRSGIDNIVREAELEDARKALNSVRNTDPSKALQDLVDPTGEVDEEMRSLEKTAKEATKAEPKIEAKPSAAPADGGETSNPVESQETAKSDESAQAKIVKEPEKVAPAHSLRPPPGEDPFAQSAEKAAAAAESESKPAAEAPTESAGEQAATGGDEQEQEKERRPA